MNTQKMVCTTFIETPLGTMLAAAGERGLCMLEYADYKLLDLELKQLSAAFKAPLTPCEHPLFDALRQQLQAYFAGDRRDFDLPIDLVGTEFQKQVWRSLLQIPYGQTTTYARQAALVGKPSAMRAVANANGRNKISIILPCHRIIGADGSLTGYGGGLWRKQKLLDLEKTNIYSTFARENQIL